MVIVHRVRVSVWMACFVSLCLELVLGDFVPTTVSEGRLGLYQDDFNFFIDSPTLGRLLVWAGLVWMTSSSL